MYSCMSTRKFTFDSQSYWLKQALFCQLPGLHAEGGWGGGLFHCTRAVCNGTSCKAAKTKWYDKDGFPGRDCHLMTITFRRLCGLTTCTFFMHHVHVRLLKSLFLYLQARETLAEIPNQFTSFMKTNNIKPNPPPLRHQQSAASFQPNHGMYDPCMCVSISMAVHDFGWKVEDLHVISIFSRLWFLAIHKVFFVKFLFPTSYLPWKCPTILWYIQVYPLIRALPHGH